MPSISRLEQLQWLSDDSKNQYIKSAVYELEKNQWLSRDEQEHKQLQQLKLLVQHCFQQVPYYREILKDIDLANLTFETFSRIPVLGKDTIRAREDQLIASSFKSPENAQQMKAFHTSGSTGTPMRVFRGTRNILFTRAISLHYHLCHQRDFSLSNASIMTLPSSANNNIGNWASNIKTGPGYALDISQNTDVLWRRLIEIQPHYIQTHPSTLKRLLEISREKNQSLENLKEVRTFGEILEPAIRKLCGQLWQVPLADNYSCEEVATMAFTCKGKQHYHPVNDNLYLEIVDADGNRSAPGQVGRILVTQLKNMVMPLLRYELGDMGVWGTHCDCGRHLPVIERIEGRKRNLVILPDGNTFHPVFDEEKILQIAYIQRYQFIQTSLFDIEVNLLSPPLTQKQEQALSAVFDKTFKHSFNYHFIYQNELPFSKRNKFELFKCEVK